MRTLEPYFFISTRIVGWRCSECQQLFRLDGTASMSSNDPPEYIRREFEKHACDFVNGIPAAAC